MELSAIVASLQRRWRRVGAIEAATAGIAAWAGVMAIGLPALGASVWSAAMASLVAGVVASVTLWRVWHRWTRLAVAHAVEAAVPGLENLVVTAVELTEAPGRASARMRAEIERQATARARTIQPSVVAPMRRPLAHLAIVAIGAAAVLASLRSGVPERLGPSRGGPDVPVIGGVSVAVTPPAYLGRVVERHENPERLAVPAGSDVRLEVTTSRRLAWLEQPDAQSMPLTRDGERRFAATWRPTTSGTIAIAAGNSAGAADGSRLMAVQVVADEAPRVRISAPGRDLAFTTATHVVAVAVEAEDREGLRALDLGVVRLSGSGESFAFTETRVPLSVERVDSLHWRATGRISLAGLKLDDGDSLVYRALARDTNPDGEWTASDAFTIDVGRRLEFAGAGAALPDEDRRYALSQQMVILKTERLEAERGRLTASEIQEQARGLAVEQRMVRAEVVFLSGGEVEDEVEEAAHSDELQEGRLENAGRAEMLSAITEMSRAEARLNAADTRGALVFERAALAALQRAFDRRRYFLRTLPERARIDVSRRLSGDRATVRTFPRAEVPIGGDAAAVARELMAELIEIAASGRTPAPGFVARLASIDTTSDRWRAAATSLASARMPEERSSAATAAMALVSAHARGTLAPSAPSQMDGGLGSLQGWWADESRARRPR